MYDFSRWKMVVGLGNPGPEYEETYHNAGILALENLAASRKLSFKQPGTKPFDYAKNEGVIFVRPATFMNESGRAVRAALDYFGITPPEMLILHDDSDLAIGEAKIQFGRGAAGHKGIESIIRETGSQDFWRMRLGIRTRPGKAGDFVLKRMSKAEMDQIYGAAEGCQVNEAEKCKPSDSFLT